MTLRLHQGCQLLVFALAGHLNTIVRSNTETIVAMHLVGLWDYDKSSPHALKALAACQSPEPGP
jgi:hypothetical protein